jgi:hypothetical protein
MWKNFTIFVLFGLVLLISVVLFEFYQLKPKQFSEIYNYHGYPEDVLIILGDEAIPIALEKIKNKETKKRSFIISFLGNQGVKEAIPILETIISDENDENRESALFAIAQIDNDLAIKYANKYKDDNGKLGKASRDILNKEPYVYERTSYVEAWLNYLDLNHE